MNTCPSSTVDATFTVYCKMQLVGVFGKEAKLMLTDVYETVEPKVPQVDVVTTLDDESNCTGTGSLIVTL